MCCEAVSSVCGYHRGDDGRGGGDLVVRAPLRRLRGRVEEEGLQNVLPEGHVIRPLPAEDELGGTERINHQITHTCRL